MSHQNSDRLLLVEKVLILKSLSIFKNTPEHILADLAPLMEEEEYEKGADVFKEGDVGDCMFIIYQGEVKIHKRNIAIVVLGEKEVFGELALLDPEVRSASATANTDSMLFRIDQEPFYELLENRPEIARGFIKILCQRLRAQNEKTLQGTG
jgi:CRP/FNR family transcriptional regulator, cyclic AMP receptor protein